MGKPRVPIDPVADLRRRLAAEQGDGTHGYWSRYIRGTPQVPMARVRSCVRNWWDEHGLAEHPTVVGKRVALALIEQPATEDKLSGILILQELLGTHLRSSDLAAFAKLFVRGHLADTTVVDWFALKVLATLLDRSSGRTECARTIAQWRAADSIWQRRAACIAFTRLAASGDTALPGLADLIFVIAATVVWSGERDDQTAVGWVLRELSRAEPDRVEAFFRKHALLMSKECARHATAKFPPERRKQLLAHHHRVTSLQT